MKPITVGLLPLYVQLYDRADPGVRIAAVPFVSTVEAALASLGVDVVVAPVCCVATEVETAMERFEARPVDVVVTLHLAYSPSGETLPALCRTSLPLVVLDTTPAFDFGPSTPAPEMMLNHGIHGVQDLCSGLARAGVPFLIQAGHLDDDAVRTGLLEKLRAARIVRGLRTARVGAVGAPFPGMDDFQVSAEQLRDGLGVTVVPREERAPGVVDIGESRAVEQAKADLARFRGGDAVDWTNLVAAERAGLALRAWVESERLTAVTASFTAAAAGDPALPIMPFLECSRLMERGVGYAGEGDLLTSSWVGALLGVYDDTTFTEMFCPDWRGGSVFLSHMGEFNYRVSAEVPVLRNLPFPYSTAADTVVAVGTLRPGPAVLANLSPTSAGGFRLVLCDGEMLPVEGVNNLGSLVNGWFRPGKPLAGFLEQFSLSGATHHSALVYGREMDTLRQVGALLGVETIVL